MTNKISGYLGWLGAIVIPVLIPETVKLQKKNK
jgi:hypothetical protein